MKRFIAIAAVVFAAPAAVADKQKDIDALFKKAKKLHGEKKYSEACPLFEKTDAMDPAIGAKLNVAKCYEDWGMLARAYRWYVDAEKMAKDTKDKRAEKIKELIEAIDSDVPRLMLKLPEGADPKKADVKVDNKPFAINQAERVDPGPHEITWVVEDQKKSKTIPIDRGSEREMMLDMRRDVAGEGTTITTIKTDPEPVSPPDPGRNRRIAAYALGGAGVLGLGIASYLTLDARSTYKDALDAHCMGSSNMCNDEGLSITGDARSQANIATVVTVLSLAAIGGGVALYLTAPKTPKEANKTVYVTPVLGDGAGGIVVRGGF